MFTTRVPKPKASETWDGVGKPEVSETYTKVGKPKASENWVPVLLLTGPSNPLADIAEADIAILDS